MALQKYAIAAGAFNDADAGGNNYHAGIPVYVFNKSDDTPAAIFTDETGATPILQNGVENITNSSGVFEFAIDEGQYYFQANGTVQSFAIAFTDHSALTNRDAPDAHPASAIQMTDGVGSIQDAITYATPEMYGLANLDQLQAQEEANLADKKFRIYAGVRLRNSRTSTGSLIDAPNFAGQTDYGNEPIGVVFHHYTDGTVMQVDNVGEDNDILVLKNAHNPNRRSDKASDFVGNASYLRLAYHDYDDGYSKSALFIDKDTNFVWTGAKGTAKLWQNKEDDGVAAFRLQTTNSHVNIFDVLNGLDKTRSLSLRNDVGFTRLIFRSEPTQTSGIGLEAQAGDVWLLTNDSSSSRRIKVNKPIQHINDNTQLTAQPGKLVESFVPMRNRGYNFSSLPDASLYAGACVHVIDRGYRQAYSNGTDWLFVSDDTVVS